MERDTGPAQGRKLLSTLDAALPQGAPMPGAEELATAAIAAVESGGGNVLDRTHVTFPNGAVTLVLILAESHLALHTWPEENLIAIDLFSCGAIDGDTITSELARRLGLSAGRAQQIERGLG